MGADRISLEDIARKHGTLKVQHGYMPIYERFFAPLRDAPINILEIGVHEGASLKTWAEYFKYAMVRGVDKELIFKSEDPRITTYEGDACTIRTYGEVDIAIDDGSHVGHEQIATFIGIWDSVTPGGWYVVEDLFAAYDPVWNPSGPIFIDMIQARLKNILIGGDDIQEVHWFGRNDINGILFLRKRYEKFRIQPLTEFNEKAIIDN